MATILGMSSQKNETRRSTRLDSDPRPEPTNRGERLEIIGTRFATTAPMTAAIISNADFVQFKIGIPRFRSRNPWYD
jgi:hypothetical protein